MNGKRREMSDAFDQFLSGELEAIEAAGLLRTLRRMESPQQIEVKAGGQELINFSSNDYLGLAAHVALKKAAQSGVEALGAGAGVVGATAGAAPPRGHSPSSLVLELLFFSLIN